MGFFVRRENREKQELFLSGADLRGPRGVSLRYRVSVEVRLDRTERSSCHQWREVAARAQTSGFRSCSPRIYTDILVGTKLDSTERRCRQRAGLERNSGVFVEGQNDFYQGTD